MTIATSPSRHDMLPKGSRSARPRFHLIAPVSEYTDREAYAALKSAGMKQYAFFDKKALDAARLLYGANVKSEDIFWHEGRLRIDDALAGMEPGGNCQTEPSHTLVLYTNYLPKVSLTMMTVHGIG